MKRQAGIIICVWLTLAGCINHVNHRGTLTLLIGGDVLLDRGVAIQLERYGPELLLQDVRPLLKRADFTLLNLECPVTHGGKPRDKRYCFRGDPKWLTALRSMGITHFGVANNHSMDQGASGFQETLNNLEKTGFEAVGLDLAGYRPAILNKEDIHVALFAFNVIEVDSAAMGEAAVSPCQASIEQMCSQFQQHKIEHPSDVIVAIPHWGQEYRPSPSSTQKLHARMLIEAGADAVVGHHPHVVQGYEEYLGKPIVYSVGNFLFDQSSPETAECWLAELQIDRKGNIRPTIHRYLRDGMFGLRDLIEL